MGSKEYTGEIAEVFGKRPAKVLIEQEDGSPKNWEWNEFRKRLIQIHYRMAEEAVDEAIDVSVTVTFKYLRNRTSSLHETAKIAIDEVRRKRGGLKYY